MSGVFGDQLDDGTIPEEKLTSTAQAKINTHLNPFVVSITGNQIVEVGNTIVEPTFNVTYSNPPTQASLQDDQGNPALNILELSNPITYPYTYQLTAPGSVKFTVTAQDEAEAPGTAEAEIVWAWRVFWGAEEEDPGGGGGSGF